MNLDERDLKKIKSLHVMLKMPIWILEKETNKVLKKPKIKIDKLITNPKAKPEIFPL